MTRCHIDADDDALLRYAISLSMLLTLIMMPLRVITHQHCIRAY